MKAFFFEHALLPAGWAHEVRIDVDDGTIVAVQPGSPAGGAERIPGIALAGLPNLHCHAFQRAIAGLAERRGAADSFWSWRAVMYGFLAALTPDDVEAIAAFAYMEMLERGFTAVGEFHYLHHDVDGRPFADVGEMAARIATAAAETGIGLTLLPSFYANGDFGGVAALRGQRRFLNDPDGFLRLLARTREIAASVADAAVGIAPHSLRAVTPKTLRAVVEAGSSGPIHIHVAEQTREVVDCVAALGQPPVDWLIDNFDVGPRWCLVHATHMGAGEISRVAHSGAVAGLCPLTEANLGDGIFRAAEFLAESGRFGVGSDSNIEIDGAAELRQLEYSQRLKLHARNVLAAHEGQSTGRRLYEGALAGGAQALGRGIGSLEVGRRADIVILAADHPDLAGRRDDSWLDSYVFVAGSKLVRTVMVGGTIVVSDGRHRARAVIAERYRKVVTRLISK
ncbi:MAG: formimidoylglutamate deiminase [Hyphomicrobiales bacterium]|nr:formimidoylglutamate deiminase [Hyphomicrobiales bacterium]MBV8825028.1 formimidoylglutamate deiminase [Hyphomicrobiales bacterium]MBV9429857.1 formimidoylglutamate deiminase [Bradyrhizobiaceae bacterium]